MNDNRRTIQLSEVDEAVLRAWVEAGVISIAVCDAELKRRAGKHLRLVH